MNSNGIFITTSAFLSLEKSSQNDILSKLLGTSSSTAASTQEVDAVESEGVQAEPGDHEADSDGEINYAELSPSQAREFYNGCGDRTKKAIKAMVSGGSRLFEVADVARAVGVTPAELRGVWGGLTRRLRTVMGTSDEPLIDWTVTEPEFDEAGDYFNQTAQLSEMTYHSFRKILKI